MIERRFVDVSAPTGERPASIAVHVAGSGPLAVLVHGFPLDHRMWIDVLHGPLARRRTLCAIDLRGHGSSPWCGDRTHTVERLADDVAAVIRALGDGPADVAGLSMGGYVAFALWARHRDLVHTLVLSNTRAAGDNPAQRQARDDAINLVTTKGRTALADAMLPRLLAPGADPVRQAQVRTMIEGLPIETIVADQRGLQQRPDRTTSLAGIAVPTLVVGGDADPITPPADARHLQAGIPGAQLAIVPGTAHLTPLEQPLDWAAAVGGLWR